MEPIVSGTTTERLVRTAILTLLFAGYSAWSFVDGYYTYPKKNVLQLMQNLSPVPESPPPVNRAVTQKAVESLADKSEADVLALLGDPVGVSPLKDERGRSLGNLFHYFGPGGLAQIRIQDGQVTRNGIIWRDGPKTEASLFIQFVIGGLTGVLGLIMIVQLLRVITTRIELSDQGLKVSSQGGWQFGSSPQIPFEAMTGFRDPQNRFADRRSDFIELKYTLSDGTTGQVKINNYVHAAFADIITEICRQKGFANPLDRESVDQDDEPTRPSDDQSAAMPESETTP
ncbi:MAG: hypothetical protein ACE5GE_07535 [Phycisphaerae bacterium]